MLQKSHQQGTRSTDPGVEQSGFKPGIGDAIAALVTEANSTEFYL
ncbi:hypothetical protein ACQ4M4_00975 [Leptolyngbya sp. AN02str]